MKEQEETGRGEEGTGQREEGRGRRQGWNQGKKWMRVERDRSGQVRSG